MITLILLGLIAAILIIAGIVTILVGGAAFILTFGDVIIAGIIIYFIIRHFVRKHKNKDQGLTQPLFFRENYNLYYEKEVAEVSPG